MAKAKQLGTITEVQTEEQPKMVAAKVQTEKKTKAAKPKADKPKKTKTAKPAAKSTAPEASTNGHTKTAGRDDCAAIAKVSGKFSAAQVRILRCLAKAGKPISRTDIKEGVGIGRDGKYSQSWLNELKDLDTNKYIRICVRDDEKPGYTHEITALGKKALLKAEEAFAKSVTDKK